MNRLFLCGGIVAFLFLVCVPLAAKAEVFSASQLVEVFISLGIIAPEKAETARAAVANLDIQLATSSPAAFARALELGVQGEDVRLLQKILNRDALTQIAETGAGSPGNETDYFGPRTQSAVVRFQEMHAGDVLAPVGLAKGTGYVGTKTLAKLNSLVTEGAGNSSTTPSGLLNAPGLNGQIATTSTSSSQAKQGPPSVTPSGTSPATPATPATPSSGGGGGGSAAAPATPATPATPAEQTAPPDTTPPEISGVQTSNLTATSATVTWVTDEPSTSVLYYASSSPVFATTTIVVSSAEIVTNHSLSGVNVTSYQTYYYVVVSSDAAGNTATSTEQSFTSPSPIFSTYSNPTNNRSVPSITPVREISGLNHPAGIAISPSNEIYVADYHNDNVKVYDSSYNFVRTLGSSRGSAPGQFSKPWDIAFDNSGNAFITDTNNRRIQVFSPEGTYLRQFSSSDPQGIAINGDGLIYIGGRVLEVFNNDGQKVTALPLGSNYYPRNIAIDRSNRVYFANYGNSFLAPPYDQHTYDENNSITVQSPQGELLNKTQLGYVPYFIAIDDLFRIWVADYTNGKIRVYDSEAVFITEFNLPFSSMPIGSAISLNSYNPVGLEIHDDMLYASVMGDNLVRVYSIEN